MRRCLALVAILVCLLLSAISRAQVPEAQGRCVSGCSSNSGSNDNPYGNRSAARLADQRRRFDKVKRNDDDAAKKSRDQFHKGRDAAAKGDQCGAAADFQRSLSTIQSSDVSTPAGIWDGPLNGEYMKLQVRQNENVRVVSNALTAAQAQCAQQARNRVPASPAAAGNNNQQATANFRVESATQGVTSCYRADPAKTSCLEVRNNSVRRVRVYIEGLPGVQCTVSSQSYCSLPIAIGHQRLRMVADDEQGTGPIIGADVDLPSPGTRLTLASAN